MTPVLFNLGLNTDPTACDSVTIELYTSGAIPSLVYSKNVLLHINGTITDDVPGILDNQSLYIVIRHRNSMETWSKNPVVFTVSPVTFDFTTPNINAARSFPNLKE